MPNSLRKTIDHAWALANDPVAIGFFVVLSVGTICLLVPLPA